jgi:hypothetical protein
MRMFKLLPIALLLTAAATATADALPAVPDDYPSHAALGDCNLDGLRARLRDYNRTRLDVAPVLRRMALGDPSIGDKSRAELLKFATNLDEMRQRLPEPDPDSTEFRNFDFRLGMTLTAIAVYLNTQDEQLSARFIADRDNPDSELGRYLVRLDMSRQSYMDDLEAVKAGDCRS